MPLISDVLSPVLVNTIGWTLVHSIWQGALIALAGLCLFLLWSRSSARARYRIGVCLLVLMLAATLVTALLVYRAEVHRGAAVLPAPAGAAAGPLLTDGPPAGFRTWFDRSLPMMVTAWFLGALFLFLRFVGGILTSQRLRNHHTRDVPPYWAERLNTLARRVRVRWPVVLRESRIARTPMTIGHLKPVILFPLGMLAQMPPSQVETLLVHELAHILRRDYLVNVLQSLMDILYFYHPGVRWISQQIRLEREHCCDDLTVSALGDRINYARALSRVGESSLERADLAMAASKDSVALLQRIRRLLTMNSKRTRLVDGITGLAVTGLFLFSLAALTTVSGRLFAASPQDAAAQTQVTKEEARREVVDKLLKRYRELSSRETDLTDREKAELDAVTRQLKVIKKEEEQKKIAVIKAELETLQAKKTLSREEELQRQKYTQFLAKYEQKRKLMAIKETYRKLKIREKELSAEEQKKLQAIHEKLKAVELEERERQKALAEKEAAREAEREVREQEVEKLELQEMKARQAEEEMRRKEEIQARKAEFRALKEEYLQLEKNKARTREQDDELKKVTHRLQEIKLRHQALLEKKAVLEQKIKELKSRRQLSAAEREQFLQLEKEKQKVSQELALY